jgi:hypothetical protein
MLQAATFTVLGLQVEQHAFDALLRKMPDVIIDFSSAVPVQVFHDTLNLCNSKSGFVRRERSHDAGSRNNFYCEGADAASLRQEFTWAVQAVVVECSCDLRAYAQVRSSCGESTDEDFFCQLLHIIMTVSTQFIVAYEREAHFQNAIYCAGDCLMKMLYCCVSCLPCLCSLQYHPVTTDHSYRNALHRSMIARIRSSILPK